MDYTIGEPLTPTFSTGVNQFSFGFQQPEMNIAVGTIAGGPFCAGSQISIPFTPQGVYAIGNNFTAQLSDSAGSFATFVTIGFDTTAGYDTIIATLPTSVTGGSGYRVRVVASLPGFVGGVGVSGPFIINYIGPPSGVIPRSVCNDTTYTFIFDSVTTGRGGNQVEWAMDSNFTSPHLVNSGDSFGLTVAIGNGNIIWLRTIDSLTGCVSASIGANLDAIIMPPDSLASTFAISNWPLNFEFSNVRAGCGADQIEWSEDSAFTSSTIMGSGADIYLTVDTNSTSKLWLRSRNSSTGLFSKSVSTTAKILDKYPPPNVNNYISMTDPNGSDVTCTMNYYSCTGATYTFTWVATSNYQSGIYSWQIQKQSGNANIVTVYASSGFFQDQSGDAPPSISYPFTEPGQYFIVMVIPSQTQPLVAKLSVYGENDFTAAQVSPDLIPGASVTSCNEVFIKTDYISVNEDYCPCTDCDNSEVGPIQELVVDWGDGLGQQDYWHNGGPYPSSTQTKPYFPGYLFYIYTNPGYYNVTLYSGIQYTSGSNSFNPCSAPYQVRLQVLAGIPVVTATNTIICSNNSGSHSTTIQASSSYDPNGSITYNWSNGSSGPSITVSPVVTTTYNVTVTGISTITCSSTGSITINVGSNCCQGDPTTSGTTSPTYTFNMGSDNPSLNYILTQNPALQSPATPVNVALNGDFPVAINGDFSQNVLFQNINFLMGPDSRIDVGPGQTLNLNYCTLKSCGEMWDGIYVEPGAQICTMQNGVLEDARNGITINGDANSPSVITSNYFYNNYSSINIINGTENPVIRNNTFDFQSPMMPQSDGTTPYTHPLYGIKVQSSTLTIPDDMASGNTFQNINCGIFALESSVSSYNNTFNNISGHETPNSFGGGMGIFAYNGLGALSGTANSLSSINDNYTGCNYGINAQYVSLYADKGTYTNDNYGIYTTNCTDYISVLYNNMSSVNYGVTLNSNNNVNQNVGFNTISVNEPVSYVTHSITPFGLPITYYVTPNYYGIAQNDVIGTSSNIFINTITGGQNCISLTNANSTQVYSNHLTQNGVTPVNCAQAGVAASNCKNLNIALNFFDGNGLSTYNTANFGTAANNRKSGIYLNSTSSATVCGNVVAQIHSIGYGMFFAGYGPNVNVWHNSFNTSKYAMELQANGATSILADVQAQTPSYPSTIFDNGNIGAGWTGPFIGTSLGATNTLAGTNYHAPKFYFTSFADEPTNNLPPFPPSLAVMTEFIADIPVITCPIIYLYPGPGLNWKFGKSRVHETEATGYADTLMEPGYKTTGAWLAKRNLYAALCDSTPPIPRFNSLPPNITSVLTAYIDTTTDTLLVSGAAELLSAITSGDTVNNSTDSLVVDTLITNFFAANQNSDFNAIQASLNQVRKLRDTSIVKDSKVYTGTLAGAYTLLANVPDTNAQTANFVAVMSIYLNYMAPGDTIPIDTASLNTLDSIAFLCPYAAGDAVYYARAMLAQNGDTIFYDDLQLCPIDSTDSTGHGGERLHRVNNSASNDTTTTALSANSGFGLEFAKVYPNPAKQIINLAYYVNTAAGIEFDLIDQLGVPVLQQTLGNTQNSAQFNTGNLSNGLYYWVLKDPERTIKTGKVAIIK